MPVVDVDGLTFTYASGTSPAVRDLSFRIDRGEIFGFLGPSGAGKSTTQKVLIGLLRGYRGAVSVLGRDLAAWGGDYYEEIGVSFELPNHYLRLTGLENLGYFRALYRGETRRPEALLEMVGLADDGRRLVAEYSKGMKTRLGVARALLNDPQLIFLDEPTVGLDPASGRGVRHLVRELKQAGRTVFLTTHDMTVADELCDRVAFIVDGEIRLVDSPRDLKLAHGARTVAVEYDLRGEPGRRSSRSTASATTPGSWPCCAKRRSARCTPRKPRSRTSSCASPATPCSEPMHRLAATVRLDLRLQWRNGFYYVVAFVLACWFVLLTRLPAIDWGYVLPAVVFGNLVMVNFYFIAGLVLLEKGEGTLEAQVVTPLADWEYLASKTATLTALSLVEQVVIVWSAHGGGFAVGPLVAGIVLAAVLYTLVGFLLIARYRSINEYMFPSILFTAVLSLPMLHYFGLWDTWLLLSPSLHGAPRAAGGGLPAASVVAMGLRRALCRRLRRAARRTWVHRRGREGAAARSRPGGRSTGSSSRAREGADADGGRCGPGPRPHRRQEHRARACCAGWWGRPSRTRSPSGGGSPSSAPGSTSATGSTSRRTIRCSRASSCSSPRP